MSLTRSQLTGLKKLGDVLIPGDRDLPRFSETNVYKYADRMLDYMEESDRSSLKLLLTVFSVTPNFLINALLKVSQSAEGENFISSNLRLLSTGLRGVIFTLYYSKLGEYGEKIGQAIKWDSQINSIPEGEDEMQHFTDEYKDKAQIDINENVEDATHIMTVARNSQEEMRNLSMDKKLSLIGHLREVIIEKREWIIDRIQEDNGKSRSDALISEVFGVLDHLHWLEKSAKKALKDESIKTPIALMGKKSKIFYEPLGTILVISPWNYPFYQGIVPITAAFVAGNAVVYKPSEITPLKGLMEELFRLAGFKENWIQIVYGTGEMGAKLIDQRPDKIFFTGSVATGKKIMAQASQQLIPVELELGGKDPMVVFEDADIERTTSGAVWGALTCTGQSCTSIEQLHVHEEIYPHFKKRLLEKVATIKQGVDTDGDGDIGIMTSDAQVKIVASHLEDALSKGAVLLSGESWDRSSKTIPPLVLESLSDDMLIVNEETFGPIIPMFKFSSEQDLINKLNQSKFGLSASVWSADKERCVRVARLLQTGNVSINNVMLTEGNPALPFGGVKDSGIGRYKGVHGLRGFCNMKSILIDSNSNKCEVNWFPYTEKKYKSFDKMMVALFSGGIKNFLRFAITGIGLESYSDKIAKKGRKR